MHFVKLVAILVSRILAFGMANPFVTITPRTKPVVNVVLVRMNQSAFGDHSLDQWFDRLLLDVLKHSYDKSA